MSRGPTGPRRIRAQRERTVGSRRASSSAHRTIVTPAGGSSSVLSSAAWASSFIRSRRLDDRHPCAALDRQQRELADQVPDATVAWPPGRRSRPGRPGPSGARRWRSGWSPCSTSRHPRQDRHGRAAGSRPCTAARPRGRARASSCRRRPARSAGSRAARAPRTMASIAASAASVAPGPGAVHATVRRRRCLRVVRRFGAAASAVPRRPRSRRPTRPWRPACGSCGASAPPFRRRRAGASPSIVDAVGCRLAASCGASGRPPTPPMSPWTRSRPWRVRRRRVARGFAASRSAAASV